MSDCAAAGWSSGVEWLLQRGLLGRRSAVRHAVVCCSLAASAAVFANAASLPAAELETGTVIVVAFNGARIVVAADSRASFMKEGFQDEVCKISNPARNVVFAAAGIAGTSTWSARDIAQSVARRHVGDNPYLSASTLESIAQAWAREMADRIRELPPASVLKYLRDSQSSAVFAGLDRSDAINLVQVQLQPVAAAVGVDVRIQVKPVAVDPARTQYLVLGRPQIAMEFLKVSSERARVETSRWPEYFSGQADPEERVALRLIELTNYLDPRKDLVGGSTAALRLDGKSGLRWIERPPTCL